MVSTDIQLVFVILLSSLWQIQAKCLAAFSDIQAAVAESSHLLIS